MVAHGFDAVVSDPMGGRQPRPRLTGQTMVIDKGLGLAHLQDLLQVASEHLDYIKLGFGTSALYPTEILRAKIDLARQYGLQIYPGGTFLEVALTQGVLDRYLRRARELGFTCIEVSDGTIEMTPRQRRQAIEAALALDFTVITEVGKKDGEVDLNPLEALDLIHTDLAHGAAKVIVEGRESGQGVGIYNARGELKTGQLEEIVAGLSDPSVLMWEAPQKLQQQELIIRFGPNVNLGNIAPEEVLAVEALRRGLRGDTLRHALLSEVVREEA